MVRGRLTGVPHKGAPPPSCPISWLPNALAPVFYGYQDFEPEPVALSAIRIRPDRAMPERAILLAADVPGGQALGPETGFRAPTWMRVLFPTIDGSPQDAQILSPCGLYPLIVFAHGQCVVAQQEHYLHWAQSQIPAQLARAGYVVVVPKLSGSATSESDLDILRRVVGWMRSAWIHSQLLAPSTGTIGHSHGGVLAGLLATEGGVDAFAELSAAWHDAPLDILPSIGVPQLHLRGSGEIDELSGLYEQASRPKHRAVIAGAEHYDYLPVTPCQDLRGPCSCTPGIAADVVTMFFGKYLPPPAVPDLPQLIPTLLRPPPLTLSLEQEFYAGGYLSGFSCLASSIDHCSMTLSFDTSTGSQTESIPWTNVTDHRTT